MLASEGDHCPKFFHSTVLEKRHRLAITKVKDAQGQWLSSDAEIREHAIQFYEHLFQVEFQDSIQESLAREQFLSYVPTQVFVVDNDLLLQPISLKEVKSVVFQMDPDIAPGIDGFPGHFYQAAWDVECCTRIFCWCSNSEKHFLYAHSSFA